MQDLESLQTISYKLRAVAHVFHYADYVQEITDDANFLSSLIDVTSDWMYLLADKCRKSFDAYDVEERKQSEEIRQLQERLVKFQKLVDGSDD